MSAHTRSLKRIRPDRVAFIRENLELARSDSLALARLMKAKGFYHVHVGYGVINRTVRDVALEAHEQQMKAMRTK